MFQLSFQFISGEVLLGSNHLPTAHAKTAEQAEEPGDTPAQNGHMKSRGSHPTPHASYRKEANHEGCQNHQNKLEHDTSPVLSFFPTCNEWEAKLGLFSFLQDFRYFTTQFGKKDLLSNHDQSFLRQLDQGNSLEPLGLVLALQKALENGHHVIGHVLHSLSAGYS